MDSVRRHQVDCPANILTSSFGKDEFFLWLVAFRVSTDEADAAVFEGGDIQSAKFLVNPHSKSFHAHRVSGGHWRR